MSLGAYKPATPFSSLNVVVGLTEVKQRLTKVTQQRAEFRQGSNEIFQQNSGVSRVTKRSRKIERSIEDTPNESDKISANSALSENRSENRSANYSTTSSEKLVQESRTENKPRPTEFDAVTSLIRMYLETMVEEPGKTTRRQRASSALRKRSVVSAPSSSRDLPFDPDELQGYDWTGTQRYYITAEFTPEELEEGILFVLGDGEYYGR